MLETSGDGRAGKEVSEKIEEWGDGQGSKASDQATRADDLM